MRPISRAGHWLTGRTDEAILLVAVFLAAITECSNTTSASINSVSSPLSPAAVTCAAFRKADEVALNAHTGRWNIPQASGLSLIEHTADDDEIASKFDARLPRSYSSNGANPTAS